MGIRGGPIVDKEIKNLSKASKRDLLEKFLRIPGDQNPLNCMQCGKCTSGCTVMLLLENYPHRVVGRVKIGLIDELLKSNVIWACTRCLKCKETCPQQVSPVEVFLALRSLSLSEGQSLPEAYMKMLSTTIETGFIQEPVEVIGNDGEKYSREKLNLPPIKGPKSLKKYQTALMTAFERSVR